MPLINNVALVTGAARGMGRSIALALADKGARLALNDTQNNRDELDWLVDLIRSKKGDAMSFAADVTDSSDVSSMVNQVIKHLGSIDILINNAGINRNGLMKDPNITDWEAVLSVNLTGSFNCIGETLKHMRDRNYGRIVNIASVVGLTGIPGTPYYAAAKAGLMGLTRATAAEVARRGITVNAIAPGYVETGMGLLFNEAQKKNIEEKIPMGRFARPEEIAEVVCFLASPQASYITGSIINVSGGYYM